jgi:hypothetical protein
MRISIFGLASPIEAICSGARGAGVRRILFYEFDIAVVLLADELDEVFVYPVGE